MQIAGKLDGIFQPESSQIPIQKLLGTPKKDQKIIVLEDVGHGIPRNTINSESSCLAKEIRAEIVMVVRGVTQSRIRQGYRAGDTAVVALTIALIRDTYSNPMITLQQANRYS